MKSSTYGFFVMLAFLSNFGEKFSSVNALLEVTDSIARDMKCDANLHIMTKYNVVYELEKNGLIVLHKKGQKRVGLRSDMVKFVFKWSSYIEEDEE